jgi:hypothetical protein
MMASELKLWNGRSFPAEKKQNTVEGYKIAVLPLNLMKPVIIVVLQTSRLEKCVKNSDAEVEKR